MKITTLNPLIVTRDSAPIIKLFEELGFERRHKIEANTGNTDFASVRMKNEGGFYVDIAEIPGFPQQDLSLIRMNVDDFDEAYNMLLEKGFTHPSGKTVDTRTNKSCMMKSPSGFAFDLCQHIKE